ncbi:MAG: hypothetical protein Q9225_007795, partial [Loekoesia sp. 1 TL-2023]
DLTLVLPRAPAGGARIGKPHDEPDAPGAPHDPEADPVSEPGAPDEAPPRIGTGNAGETSQEGDNGPPRIAGDPPAQGADTGPSLMGESKDYGSLKDKGIKVDNLLQTAIKNNERDVELPKLSDKYHVTNTDSGRTLGDADKDLDNPLTDADIKPNEAKYSTSAVFSKNAPAGQGAVSQGKFYDQDGVIVGEYRFAKKDINKDVDKMKPSDILWSQYFGLASHISSITGRPLRGMTNDVGKLKAFVGRNIQSRSAVETIETAHKNTKQDTKKPGVFRRDADTQDGKDAFFALLGTDSLSSVNYMIKDHHTAIGNKQITEIRTYPRDFDKNTNPGGRQKVAILAKMEIVP